MANPDLRAIIADNIKAHRERKEVSQDEFADLCGLHRTYIGSVERCERNVTLATLELLAHAVGCSVSELLTKGAVK